MTDFSSDALKKALEEGPEFMAKQDAHVKEVADREAARRAALSPEERGETPLNDDQIRAAGGYLLNDPQWVVSEGFGLTGEEANTPENRRAVIASQASAGTALPFTRDGQIAGYFPASSSARQQVTRNADPLAKAIELGQAIVEQDQPASVLVEGQG